MFHFCINGWETVLALTFFLFCLKWIYFVTIACMCCSLGLCRKTLFWWSSNLCVFRFLSCDSAHGLLFLVGERGGRRWDQNPWRLQTQEKPMLHVPQEGRPYRWDVPPWILKCCRCCKDVAVINLPVVVLRVWLSLWKPLLWTSPLLRQAQLPVRLQSRGRRQDPQREPRGGGWQDPENIDHLLFSLALTFWPSFPGEIMCKIQNKGLALDLRSKGLFLFLMTLILFFSRCMSGVVFVFVLGVWWSGG